MVYDNRKVLSSGTKLKLTDDNKNNYTIIIEKQIGCGGSCLTYSGINERLIGDTLTEEKVIVKELYPFILKDKIQRSEEGSLIILEPEISDRLKKIEKRFINGQKEHIKYADEIPFSVLPPPFTIGYALNTSYAISKPGSGELLSEITANLSIKDAFEITLSICNCIGKIHENNRLYLDLKPENIFVFENHAYLFDFDTVQLSTPFFEYCSYSEGWSAPEQKLTINGYSDNLLIGYHTDIFAIAGILLYLLTGYAPSEEIISQLKNNFDWKSHIITNGAKEILKSESFFDALDRIMRSALDDDVKRRKNKYRNKEAILNFKEDVSHLKELAENASYIDIKETIQDCMDSVYNAVTKANEASQKTEDFEINSCLNTIDFYISEKNYIDAKNIIGEAIRNGIDDYRIYIRKAMINLLKEDDGALIDSVYKLKTIESLNPYDTNIKLMIDNLMKYRGENGVQILHIVTFYQNIELVKYCVEHNADVNSEFGLNKVTPISMMYIPVSSTETYLNGLPLVRNKENVDYICKYLIENGAKQDPEMEKAALRLRNALVKVKIKWKKTLRMLLKIESICEIVIFCLVLIIITYIIIKKIIY